MLTRDNPLETLATLRRPLGVMRRGRWYPAEELQRLLDQVAGRFSAATAPEASAPAPPAP